MGRREQWNYPKLRPLCDQFLTVEIAEELLLFAYAYSKVHSGFPEVLVNGLRESKFMGAAANELIFMFAENQLQFSGGD